MLRRTTRPGTAAILAFIAVFAFAACSGRIGSRGSSPASAPSSRTVPRSATRHLPTRTLRIGQSMRYPGARVTLRAAKRGPAIHGRRTFAVTVRYENIGIKFIQSNPQDWQVQDSARVRWRSATTGPNALKGRWLDSDTSVLGTIYFPQTARAVSKVIFTPQGGYMGGVRQTAIWTIPAAPRAGAAGRAGRSRSRSQSEQTQRHRAERRRDSDRSRDERRRMRQHRRWEQRHDRWRHRQWEQRHGR